ncbi:hypothetical protein E2C06_28655 [Dankookia rubra]|uniref:Uncharacterized protein n=1 Tax=Dankookia rubra TaxID=1442381 RepID=A0A4R5QAE5_9PROT|nr:hypothetical protein [Dankookia rubra]TDH59197.1 hypothetical protein E2C06_28655 [Dankookia rubra]
MDVLIGLAVTMLVVSVVVTMITQFLTNIFNLRGNCLVGGVAKLISLLDSGIGPADARKIARDILCDPLVAAPSLFGFRRPGATIHREELTKLLLDFAARSQGPGQPSPLNAKLAASLEQNGIPDPSQALQDIRTQALELEKTNPELSNSTRVNLAILHLASSNFVGKLNHWFDQTIDRVSDAFTLRVRLCTLLAATLVALWLQLDTLALVNRLSADDALRQAVVERVLADPGKFAPPTPDQSEANQAWQEVAEASRKYVTDQLGDTDLVRIPASFDAWLQGWTTGATPLDPWRSRFAGVVLSIALLSLGAPFWYELLKNMVRLRSLVAGKDDAQREERQTTQAAPAAAPAAATQYSPLTAKGEAGNLNAIG